MNVWEKQQQYAIPELAQTQALWGQTRQRWLKHGRMPKALMVPTGSGHFVRVKTVFPTSEPAARASSPSVRRKLLNNPQVREEMADLVAGSIHEAGHAPTPERRMVRFKKKPTGHLTSALLVSGGAVAGGAHLARKRRHEQEQEQYTTREPVVQYSVKGFTSWLGKHPNLLLSAAAGSVTAAHLRRMWREHQEKRMQERYSLRTVGHQALDGIKSGFRDSRPPSKPPLAERMGRAIGAVPNELLIGVKSTAARIPGGIAKGAFLMGLGLVLAKLLERGSKYWPGAPVVRADVEGLEPYYLRLARYYTRRLCAEGSEQELHYAAAATGGFAAKARNAFLRHAVSFLAGMISAELLGRGIGRKKETHQLEHIRQPREYSAHYVMRARTVPRHGMHLIPPARIAEGEARSIHRGNKSQARSAGLRKAAKLGVPVVLLSGGVGYLGPRKKRDSELAKQYQVASWLGKAGKWLGIGAAKAAKSPWGAGVIPKGMRGAKQAAYVERMFGVPKPSTAPWTQRAMKVMKENPMIPAFGAMTAIPLLVPGPEQRVRHIYGDEEK
jgi:hypothetical protein